MTPSSSFRSGFHRKLWPHSRNFRRLVWLNAFIVCLFATGLYHSLNPIPGTAGNTVPNHPPPAQASYTPPAAPSTSPAPVVNSTAPAPASNNPPATPQPAGNTALLLQPTAALENSLSQFPKVDNSWGAVLRSRGQIPLQGFDAYYLTTGDPKNLSRADRHYAPPTSPDDGLNSDFGHYASLWKQNPNRMIYKENAVDIGVNFAWSGLHNIPAQTFAGYWVGQLDVPESSIYHFRSQHSRGNLRILLNRHRILESTNRNNQREISLRLDEGAYLLEVEYVNGWHTAQFSLDMRSEKHLLQTADLLAPLATLKLPSSTVVYAASIGTSGRENGQVNMKYPAETRPYLLLLSSNSPVKWNIYGNNPPRAIIYNHAPKGSEVRAEQQPPGISWKGKIDYREDAPTPSCRCQNGQLLCESGVDSLEKVAADIAQWTGYPLAGISSAYHADTLTMPQTIVTAQTLAEHRGNMDYIDQQRQLCQRLSGK